MPKNNVRAAAPDPEFLRDVRAVLGRLPILEHAAGDLRATLMTEPSAHPERMASEDARLAFFAGFMAGAAYIDLMLHGTAGERDDASLALRFSRCPICRVERRFHPVGATFVNVPRVGLVACEETAIGRAQVAEWTVVK